MKRESGISQKYDEKRTQRTEANNDETLRLGDEGGNKNGDCENTSRKRSKQHFGTPASSLPFGISSKANQCLIGSLLLFMFVWSLVLWQAHKTLLNDYESPLSSSSSLMSTLMKSSSLSSNAKGLIPGRQEQFRRAPYSQSTNNQFYGWQPSIRLNDDKCSWRTCFQALKPLLKNEQSCDCRDAIDTWGEAPARPSSDWVPDVTMLHRMLQDGHDNEGRPWPPSLDDELCQPMGVFGGQQDGNKELLDLVPIKAVPEKRTSTADAAADAATIMTTSTPKVLCMIYTMEENHHTNIRAMRETWAPHCDGFLAFSTKDDPRIPAIALPHDGEESYNNMWQKVRAIWHFVGTHYLDEFDFFFQGGEDLFVIPQNLKAYLQRMLEDDGKTAEDNYFVGRRFKGGGTNNYFNSGGSGYALSRGTLRKYLNEAWSTCEAKTKSSMEDVMIARCLRNHFNIGLTDTRDEELRERFHPFAPQTHLQWKPPQEGAKADWYDNYNKEWPPLLREMCCAPDSVSFHYIKKPAMVRHLHALINQCTDQ